MSEAIRAARAEDADALARIYNPYIAGTIVTFEEAAVDGAEMLSRVRGLQEARFPWLVAESGGAVVGYAYADRWKSRSAYRFAAESSVYLQEAAKGRGIGSALYDALFLELREMGLHVVIAGIALPNPESVKFHEKFGFQKVALFKEVGYKFGQWVDVGYWQAAL